MALAAAWPEPSPSRAPAVTPALRTRAARGQTGPRCPAAPSPARWAGAWGPGLHSGPAVPLPTVLPGRDCPLGPGAPCQGHTRLCLARDAACLRGGLGHPRGGPAAAPPEAAGRPGGSGARFPLLRGWARLRAGLWADRVAVGSGLAADLKAPDWVSRTGVCQSEGLWGPGLWPHTLAQGEQEEWGSRCPGQEERWPPSGLPACPAWAPAHGRSAVWGLAGPRGAGWGAGFPRGGRSARPPRGS